MNKNTISVSSQALAGNVITENISYLAITKEHQKQKGSETGKSRKINIYFYFMAEMKVLQPEGDGY